MSDQISFKHYSLAAQELPNNNLKKNIKLSQSFQYCKVGYSQFAKKYESNQWLKRKVVAIPIVFWTLTIVSCYRIACVILSGIPRAIFGNTQPIKNYIFTFVRDLEGVFGHLLTLFYDKLGLYFVEESEFNKSCYDSYEKAKIIQKQKSDTLALITSKKYDQASVQIRSFSGNKKGKDKLLAQVAEGHFDLGNLTRCLQAVNQISVESPLKDDLLEKVAIAYYDLAEKKQGYQRLSILTDSTDVIKKIVNNHTKRDNHLLKLGDKYFSLGKFDESSKVINEVSINIEKKEDFLQKIAEKFLENGKPESALKVITKQITQNHVKREDLLAKLINKYLELKREKDAVEVALLITENEQLKETMLIKSTEAYLKNKSITNHFSPLKVERKIKFLETATHTFIKASKFDGALELIKLFPLYEHKLKDELIEKFVNDYTANTNCNIQTIEVVIRLMSNKDQMIKLMDKIVESLVSNERYQSALEFIKGLSLINQKVVLFKLCFAIFSLSKTHGRFSPNGTDFEPILKDVFDSFIKLLITYHQIKQQVIHGNNGTFEVFALPYISIKNRFHKKIVQKYQAEYDHILDTGTLENLIRFFDQKCESDEISNELINMVNFP